MPPVPSPSPPAPQPPHQHGGARSHLSSTFSPQLQRQVGDLGAEREEQPRAAPVAEAVGAHQQEGEPQPDGRHQALPQEHGGPRRGGRGRRRARAPGRRPQGAPRRGRGRGAPRGAARAVAHQHAEPPSGRPPRRRGRALAALGARRAQQLVAGLAAGADQQRGDPLYGQHQRAQLHDAGLPGDARRGCGALLGLPDPHGDAAARRRDDHVRRDPAAARRRGPGRRGLAGGGRRPGAFALGGGGRARGCGRQGGPGGAGGAHAAVPLQGLGGLGEHHPQLAGVRVSPVYPIVSQVRHAYHQRLHPELLVLVNVLGNHAGVPPAPRSRDPPVSPQTARTGLGACLRPRGGRHRVHPQWKRDQQCYLPSTDEDTNHKPFGRFSSSGLRKHGL